MNHTVLNATRLHSSRTKRVGIFSIIGISRINPQDFATFRMEIGIGSRINSTRSALREWGFFSIIGISRINPQDFQRFGWRSASEAESTALDPH